MHAVGLEVLVQLDHDALLVHVPEDFCDVLPRVFLGSSLRLRASTTGLGRLHSQHVGNAHRSCQIRLNWFLMHQWMLLEHRWVQGGLHEARLPLRRRCINTKAKLVRAVIIFVIHLTLFL